MNINAENIEYLIFEKLEGNLNPSEVSELDTFLNLNPQYQELVEEWTSSNLFLTDRAEDYGLTEQLHENVGYNRNSQYALYGSLTVCISLLVGSLFATFHKSTDSDITNLSMPVQLEKRNRTYHNPVEITETKMVYVTRKSEKKGKDIIAPEITEKLEPAIENIDTKIKEEDIITETNISNIPTPDSLSQESSSVGEVANTQKVPQKVKTRSKRAKLSRDAQFQEVNSNF